MAENGQLMEKIEACPLWSESESDESSEEDPEVVERDKLEWNG